MISVGKRQIFQWSVKPVRGQKWVRLSPVVHVNARHFVSKCFSQLKWVLDDFQFFRPQVSRGVGYSELFFSAPTDRTGVGRGSAFSTTTKLANAGNRIEKIALSGICDLFKVYFLGEFFENLPETSI